MNSTQPRASASNCFKFVPYEPTAHREPITSEQDLRVYCHVMAHVKVSRDETLAYFLRLGWTLDEIEASVRRLGNSGAIDNVCNVTARGCEYWLEVPLKNAWNERD